jgi:predicted nucleotidyltransferase
MIRGTAKGVEARLVGSLPRGGLGLASDVDFLVLNCPDELRYRAEADVEDLVDGLPFDVIYFDEVARRSG